MGGCTYVVKHMCTREYISHRVYVPSIYSVWAVWVMSTTCSPFVHTRAHISTRHTWPHLLVINHQLKDVSFTPITQLTGLATTIPYTLYTSITFGTGTGTHVYHPERTSLGNEECAWISWPASSVHATKPMCGLHSNRTAPVETHYICI
jgi:hypothetical protein